MSKFTDSRDWYLLRSRDKYITCQDLSWELGILGSGLFLTVPSGFEFDVSVPSYLTWAVSRHDKKLLKSAALHDYALELGWDRISAASVFHGALTAQKIGRWRRLFLTLSVIIWKWR